MYTLWLLMTAALLHRPLQETQHQPLDVPARDQGSTVLGVVHPGRGEEHGDAARPVGRSDGGAIGADAAPAVPVGGGGGQRCGAVKDEGVEPRGERQTGGKAGRKDQSFSSSSRTGIQSRADRMPSSTDSFGVHPSSSAARSLLV